MPAAHAADRLAAAHGEMTRACELLIVSSPEALDLCQNALERAVFELREFQPGGQSVSTDPTAKRYARNLRSEVLRAARLLENLAHFYNGWERILGSMTAGYTASGDPAPVSRQGRLCFRG